MAHVKVGFLAVLAALSAGACSMTTTTTHEPALSFNDGTDFVISYGCRKDSFTGHGLGMQRCMQNGLHNEAVARASGGHDAFFAATVAEARIDTQDHNTAELSGK